MVKKNGLLLTLFISAFLLLANSVNASSILYYSDYTSGTDCMAGALASYGGTHSVTAVSSSSDFATQISSGSFDLGIFMVQGYSSSSYADAINALGAFVASGGYSIFTDWSRNSTYASLFEATWAGGTNDGTITITDTDLLTGLSNPISLYNPGWGVWSMDVDGFAVAATFSDGEGAIAFGNSGRSITNGFLTDTFLYSAEGVQLYRNEIDTLLGSAPVPEPTTMLLLGVGLLGLAGVSRKKTT